MEPVWAVQNCGRHADCAFLSQHKGYPTSPPRLAPVTMATMPPRRFISVSPPESIYAQELRRPFFSTCQNTPLSALMPVVPTTSHPSLVAYENHWDTRVPRFRPAK